MHRHALPCTVVCCLTSAMHCCVLSHLCHALPCATMRYHALSCTATHCHAPSCAVSHLCLGVASDDNNRIGVRQPHVAQVAVLLQQLLVLRMHLLSSHDPRLLQQLVRGHALQRELCDHAQAAQAHSGHVEQVRVLLLQGSSGRSACWSMHCSVSSGVWNLHCSVSCATTPRQPRPTLAM